MKHLSIYIFYAVSLLTILNIILAVKDSSGETISSQFQYKRNESLVESKMEDSSIFRRKLLKFIPENKNVDVQNYDDDYFCKTRSKLKQRGDGVMNHDCKSNGSNSENSSQLSRNNTLENLLKFRKDHCKPKKSQQKRAIDNTGGEQDTEAAADCNGKNGPSDSDDQDNDGYDANNDDVDVYQDTDYGGEGKDDNYQDNNGNYDQDENTNNNYDDNNNEIDKDNEPSDKNYGDAGLDDGYEDNNQENANDNNYDDVGGEQENDEENENADDQENEETDYGINDDYNDVYGGGMGGQQDDEELEDNYYAVSRKPEPDDIYPPRRTSNSRRRTRNPPRSTRNPPRRTRIPHIPPGGTRNRTRGAEIPGYDDYDDFYGGGMGGEQEDEELEDNYYDVSTEPDSDDVYTPRPTRNRPRLTKNPPRGTRIPHIPPGDTRNRTLGTEIPGGLGKYFVYVNCTTCKIKSQLVVLTKKGSTLPAPKNTGRWPRGP